MCFSVITQNERDSLQSHVIQYCVVHVMEPGEGLKTWGKQNTNQPNKVSLYLKHTMRCTIVPLCSSGILKLNWSKSGCSFCAETWRF